MKSAAAVFSALLLAILPRQNAFAGISPGSGIYISEIEADQPGTDSSEFIELATSRFNLNSTSLNGYFVVLVNGATDLTYRTISLTGKKMSASGYFMMGRGSAISGITDSTTYLAIATSDFLQNGSDVAGAAEGDAGCSARAPRRAFPTTRRWQTSQHWLLCWMPLFMMGE